MTELKDKDEQYSVFLKYRENTDDDNSKVIITLRVIFISFIVVVITVLGLFLFDNSSNISAIFESITDKKLANVKVSDKKPDLTP